MFWFVTNFRLAPAHYSDAIMFQHARSVQIGTAGHCLAAAGGSTETAHDHDAHCVAMHLAT